jgi:hypothetical protein
VSETRKALFNCPADADGISRQTFLSVNLQYSGREQSSPSLIGVVSNETVNTNRQGFSECRLCLVDKLNVKVDIELVIGAGERICAPLLPGLVVKLPAKVLWLV